MKKYAVGAVAFLTAVLMSASPLLASTVPCSGGSVGSACQVQVTATVASNLTFSVTILELLNGGTTLGTTPLSAMDFGNLASNGTFTPPGGTPQPRSLNSTKAFQAFFGINAQQRPFTITQTAAKLTSGGNTLPDGSFIMTPLNGVGGDPTKPLPAGITVGARHSAVGTNLTLFSRASAGPSATLSATYGITDDASLGATEFIPLDQPAGSYITTITYTATVI